MLASGRKHNFKVEVFDIKGESVWAHTPILVLKCVAKSVFYSRRSQLIDKKWHGASHKTNSENDDGSLPVVEENEESDR
jgi:hypothetical protein